MQEKQNVIIKLTFQFALEIIKYCDGLQEDKKFVIANQLLKSGTSIDFDLLATEDPLNGNTQLHDAASYTS